MDVKPVFRQTPWRNDPRSRNFSHDTFFGAVAYFLPSLGRERAPVLNQGQTLRCTGYGSAANGWYIHKSLMNPDWQAAKVGLKQGKSVDENGGDPNACMKAMRDYGFLPQAVNSRLWQTHSVQGTGWNVWERSLDLEASKFDNVSGFVKITNNNQDYFDSIRTMLLQQFNQKTGKGPVVDAFSSWHLNWMRSTIDSVGELTGYHRYVFVDWETVNGVPYLVLQNSYGETWGDKGFQYMTREVCNFVFSQKYTSLKMLATLTAEQLQEVKKETPLGRLLRAWNDFIWVWSDHYGR